MKYCLIMAEFSLEGMATGRVEKNYLRYTIGHNIKYEARLQT
jgi:hypothetical protein